jgi:hypothetical protein
LCTLIHMCLFRPQAQAWKVRIASFHIMPVVSTTAGGPSGPSHTGRACNGQHRIRISCDDFIRKVGCIVHLQLYWPKPGQSYLIQSASCIDSYPIPDLYLSDDKQQAVCAASSCPHPIAFDYFGLFHICHKNVKTHKYPLCPLHSIRVNF